MKIVQFKLKKYDNNPGFCYTGLTDGQTSFFIHKEGVVAIHISPGKSFWNGKGEILIDFVKNHIQYRTCIYRINSKRSLGLKINNFVKECVRLSNEL